MGKTVNRQRQDGRNTNNYEYKKEGCAEGFPANTSPEKFLSERRIELKPRNEKQRQYINMIESSLVVFFSGFYKFCFSHNHIFICSALVFDQFFVHREWSSHFRNYDSVYFSSV